MATTTPKFSALLPGGSFYPTYDGEKQKYNTEFNGQTITLRDIKNLHKKFFTHLNVATITIKSIKRT